MFQRNKKPSENKPGASRPDIPKYDSTRLSPAIRSSICTGEQVAGFRNKETRAFTEIMLIQSEKDLQSFKSKYGITGDIEVFY